MAGVSRQGTMWRDESVTYQVSHRSLSEIWQLLDHADAVHGLYYFFMHALFSLWDGGLLALRLPSVLATSVAAGLVGLTAFRIVGPRAGLLSGLAFSVTPEVQMYAQEGRSYALVCALVALSTYLFARALTAPSRRLWLAYAISLLAASWLHEFAILALLAHGITVALTRPAPEVRRSWGWSAAFVVIGLLPLVVFSMGQSGQVSWIGGPSLKEWFEIAGIALLALLCAKYPSGNPGPIALNRLALPLVIAPPAALLLVALYEPMYVDRYVLYANIGLALLVGKSLDWILELQRERKNGLMLVAAATLGCIAAILPLALQMRTPDSRKDDVTAIARTVREVSGKGDGVLFAPSRRREWKLSYPGDFHGLDDLALKRDPVESRSLQGEELSAAQIRTRMLTAQRIVVLSDPPGQPEDAGEQEAVKRETLREQFQECERRRVKGAQVTLYARPGACPGKP
ncbi:glycosyltransferase family 39 protein [Streptomyces sp. SYSU K217416]